MSGAVLQLDANSGWLQAVQHRRSPNADERPPGVAIDMVIIHGISLPPGQFGGTAIHELFCNSLDLSADKYYQNLKGLRVSAHLLISREGGLTQFVPFTHRAWHAGVSSYLGCCNCNDFSIGIELEGTDSLAYTRSQYRVLADVIKVLQSAYPGITAKRIVGHSDVAPGRKTDPGEAFDWQYLEKLLAMTANR